MQRLAYVIIFLFLNSPSYWIDFCQRKEGIGNFSLLRSLSIKSAHGFDRSITGGEKKAERNLNPTLKSKQKIITLHKSSLKFDHLLLSCQKCFSSCKSFSLMSLDKFYLTYFLYCFDSKPLFEIPAHCNNSLLYNLLFCFPFYILVASVQLSVGQKNQNCYLF